MNNIALNIKSWDCYSPFGNKAASVAAVRGRIAPADAGLPSPANQCALTIPNFDVRAELGSKGTRNFDRHTGMFVKCASNVIAELQCGGEALQSAAIINGSAAGSLSSIYEFLLDTYRHDLPYFVNPAHMPNTVINCASGQCAIRHGIQGPNGTVSAGSQSFYAALRMAERWARKGYARTLFVGATEEVTETTAMLYQRYCEHHGVEQRLAESVGVFALEALDAAAHDAGDAKIIGIGVRTEPASVRAASMLRTMIERMLDQAGLRPEQVGVACVESARGSAGHAIESHAVLLLTTALVHNVGHLFGQAYSAAGALQLAVLVGELPAYGYGVMCSASATGGLACALVRQGAHP